MNTAYHNEVITFFTPGGELLVYHEKKGWKEACTYQCRDGRLSVVLDDKGLEQYFIARSPNHTLEVFKDIGPVEPH